VYSDCFSGPRPATVVADFGTTTHANVNVQLDGCKDRALLARFRDRPEGNTLGSILVFEPLSPGEQPDMSMAGHYPGLGQFVAVWPPRH